MHDFITQVGVVFSAYLGIVALLVLIQIVRAYRGAQAWGREAEARVRRGLCPYCDTPLAPAPATNCPDCKNWIKYWGDWAERDAADARSQTHAHP